MKPRENTASGSWHKPLRDAGKVGMGRGFQAVCSLAYLAVATRSLGTEGFGSLVLIHSLALAIAQLARFQSWRFAIRFGAPALAKSSTAGLHRVINFGIALDLIGVLVGAGVFAAGSSALARMINLPEPARNFALLYGALAVTLINFGGSAMGVLRLLDRFTALAWQSTLEPLVRLGGSLVVLSLGGSLGDFLIVWLVALLVDKVALIYTAVTALRSRGLTTGFRFDPSVVWRADPGMWSFAWGTQWDATLKLGQRHLPMLAVGSLLGVGAAGLFKAAQQFSDAIVSLNSKLLVPAIFPEIARLTNAGQVSERKTMMLKSSAFTASLALALIVVLALFGRQLIAAVAGATFTGAYETMLWLAFAGFVGAASFTLEPYLLATGDSRSVVVASAVGLVVHFILLLLLLPQIGLVGAGMASVAQAGTQSLLLIGFILRKQPAETRIA